MMANDSPCHSNKFEPWISMSHCRAHRQRLPSLWVLFSLLRKHIFTKENEICGTNKWENFFLLSLLIRSLSLLPFCSGVVYDSHSFASLAQLRLVCFLTTKNLFQITWCCFDMSSECRIDVLAFRRRALIMAANKTKKQSKLWCGRVFFFVRHQMWLMAVDFSVA